MTRRGWLKTLPGLAAARSVPGEWLEAQEAPRGKLYVVLWFDTEDYILPQSDDAAKRVAAYLTSQGVRATFKVVGEKGRTLERRGRSDVIGALREHEIGYHSNTHSQHPTVAEYESALGWEEGVEEFTRRERPGFDDLKRIFGQTPTCYGQPGNSWAPQSYGGLEKWGVRIYLDEAQHVGLDGKPFWYGGLLNIFNLPDGQKLRPNDDWSNLAQAKADFQEIYFRTTSAPPGGLLSLYFHPCEFIHAQFWDAVNFSNGANPKPADWKLPPMKSPEECERHFKYLEDLVVYMKSFPGVQFVTASGAFKIYPDTARMHPFTIPEIQEIARASAGGATFYRGPEYTLSAGEILAILNKFVAGIVRKRAAEPGTVRNGAAPVLLERAIAGPSSDPPEIARPEQVSWGDFERTVLDVSDRLDRTHQVPSAVWFGSFGVPPESYQKALAEVCATLVSRGERPAAVTLAVPQRGIAAARYVAADTPKVWEWPIFPTGFHSAHLMGLARLQAWTLKPAQLRPA